MPLTKNQQKLVTDNINLAYAALHKSNLPVNDDTLQEAVMGLIKAATTFDDSKGAKFSTWATLKVRGHLLDFAKVETRYQSRYVTMTIQDVDDRLSQ